jgi:hypothetical protein
MKDRPWLIISWRGNRQIDWIFTVLWSPLGFHTATYLLKLFLEQTISMKFCDLLHISWRGNRQIDWIFTVVKCHTCSWT